MSALDERIRHLAREELAAAGGVPAQDDAPDPLTELNEQLAALTARVDALEKGAAPAVKRAPRKTAETPE